jgi:hypothetical protein
MALIPWLMRYPRDDREERTVPQPSTRAEARYFAKPNGMHMTRAQLPPRRLKRWHRKHKRLVVAAVRYGLITFGEACKRYRLSTDEYLSWYDAARTPAAKRGGTTRKKRSRSAKAGSRLGAKRSVPQGHLARRPSGKITDTGRRSRDA